MFKKLLKSAIIAACTVGMVAPVMAETKGKVSGRVRGKWIISSTTNTGADGASDVKESKMDNDYRFEWKQTTTMGDWKGTGHVGIENKSSAYSNIRQAYVAVENDMVKIQLGRHVYFHGLYQGEKYGDSLFGSTGSGTAKATYSGKGFGFFDALAVSYKGVPGLGATLVYSAYSKEDPDNAGTGATENETKKSTSTIGLAIKYKMDALMVKFGYAMYNEKTTDESATTSTDSKVDKTALILSASYNIDGIVPFFNYQARSVKNDDGATGAGFTEMSLGADVGLGDGMGVTVSYNTNAKEKADTDTTSKDETIIALAFAKKMGGVKISFGYATASNANYGDGAKDTKYGTTFTYGF